MSEHEKDPALVARFYAKLTGLNVKAKKDGKTFAISIESSGLTEDTASALMVQVNETVQISVRQPQLALFKPNKPEYEQARLEDAIRPEGETPAVEAQAMHAVCGVPATTEVNFCVNVAGSPTSPPEGDIPTNRYLCDAHAESFKAALPEGAFIGEARGDAVTALGWTCQYAAASLEGTATVPTQQPDTCTPDTCTGDARYKVRLAVIGEDGGMSQGEWRYLCKPCLDAVLEGPDKSAVGYILMGEQEQSEHPVCLGTGAPEAQGDFHPLDQQGMDECVCGHTRALHAAPDDAENGWTMCSACTCPAFRLPGTVIEPTNGEVAALEPEPERPAGRRHKKALPTKNPETAVA